MYACHFPEVIIVWKGLPNFDHFRKMACIHLYTRNKHIFLMITTCLTMLYMNMQKKTVFFTELPRKNCFESNIVNNLNSSFF